MVSFTLQPNRMSIAPSRILSHSLAPMSWALFPFFAAKLYWESQPTPYVVEHELADGSKLKAHCKFYHISTDEVYGALEMTNPRVLSLLSLPRQVLVSVILRMVRISSMRRLSTILTALILHLTLLTISFVLFTTPTACQP